MDEISNGSMVKSLHIRMHCLIVGIIDFYGWNVSFCNKNSIDMQVFEAWS